MWLSVPSRPIYAESLAAHFAFVTEHNPWRPFKSVPGYGLETLGLILLGMAGYKSGFLTGSWSRKRYLQVAAATLIPSFLYYGFVVQQTLRTDLPCSRHMHAAGRDIEGED